MAKKKRILVVDDEEAITLSLKYFLNEKNYEVTAASSGEEAINLLKTDSFDLFLLDIKMKGIDGIEVAKMIKRENPRTRIIMVTGFASEYEDELEKIGVDKIYSKPIPFAQLASDIENFLISPGKKKRKRNVLSKKLVFKAKILVVDKLTPAYLLSSYFRHKKGEFIVEIADTKLETEKQLRDFKPDIAIVNVSAFPGVNQMPEFLLADDVDSNIKDVIIYSDTQDRDSLLARDLLMRIDKAVDAVIFEHKLFK